ncbi:MAG: transport system, NAD-binding component [Ilumatobacteraceae bacterium]|nr:transport system, NAD-binding component [Ilumatobacteraceae bacterium]
MHVVIVGCGRVGSALAKELVEANHTVAIIDRREEAFARLDSSFTGQKIVGIGFDRDVLATAGIQHCDAVAAVTSGDNSNILIARVARENFGIERVVARIYDPQRAAVYQRLGIATVATVSWTTERVLRRVLPPTAAVEWVDPSAHVSLVERHIEGPNAGRKYTDIEDAAKVRVVAIARLGTAMLMAPTLVAQEGDLMYLAVASGEVDSLNDKLAPSAAHSSH